MALFLDVARLADELAREGGRLKKRAAIAGAIGRVAGWRSEAELADAGRFALYLAGLPFAEADARKLSAGGALLSKALLAVSGATGAQLTAAYRRHGDMGAAAFDLLVERDARREPVVTLDEVEAAFAGMASARTTAERAGLVGGLLGRATAVEAKYLLKLMLGDMRIGVKESLVEEAIAAAAGAEVGAVRHAVMLEADLGGAVRRAFAGTLGQARMRLFHPLGFMLASPVETPEEAVARFTERPKRVAVPKVRKKGRRKGVAAEAAEEFVDAAEVDTVPGEAADNEGVRAATEENKFGDPFGKLRAGFSTASSLRDDFGRDDTVEVSSGGDESSAESAGVARVEAFLEDKYDGMRAQVHCGDEGEPGRVRIYSRNREDITESFPELEEAFAHVGETGVGGLILDGEILGWDLGQARALPFAVLGQRIGRKRVSNEMRAQVPVVFMAFDVMFAEGVLQLERPLRERRNLLEGLAEELVEAVCSPLAVEEAPKVSRRGKVGQAALFGGGEGHGPLGQVGLPGGGVGSGLPGLGGSGGADGEERVTGGQPGSSAGVERLMLSPSRLVESAADIDRAYVEARARANEGVMLKAAGSVYQPGRRGLAWVKLKRELATLDVVITGAEFGSGRRAAFLSDYTFAVRGAGGELENVGKAYSGVTDAEIVELTAWLKAHTLEDFGHFRTVEPQIVIEVAFNNIMRSDRHASGFALRFPRILRIRTDKPVGEIDTVARVEAVYQSQVDKPAVG